MKFNLNKVCAAFGTNVHILGRGVKITCRPMWSYLGWIIRATVWFSDTACLANRDAMWLPSRMDLTIAHFDEWDGFDSFLEFMQDNLWRPLFGDMHPVCITLADKMIYSCDGWVEQDLVKARREEVLQLFSLE